MTLKEIRDDAKSRCNVRDSNLDAQFNNWINAGQDKIARAATWPFLETEYTITTVAATEQYDLPTDVQVIYLLRNITSNRYLDYVRLGSFYQTVPNPVATGAPYLYRLPGVSQSTQSNTPTPQIAFYPIPDAAYSIKMPYYRRMTKLTNDADISILPLQYHEMLVDYSSFIYYQSEGDSRAIAHKSLFDEGLLDMAEQLQATPVGTVDVVGSEDDANQYPIVQFPPSFGQVGWRR